MESPSLIGAVVFPYQGISLSSWSALCLGLTTEHTGDEGSRRHITVGDDDDECLYVIAAYDGA